MWLVYLVCLSLFVLIAGTLCIDQRSLRRCESASTAAIDILSRKRNELEALVQPSPEYRRCECEYNTLIHQVYNLEAELIIQKENLLDDLEYEKLAIYILGSLIVSVILLDLWFRFFAE